MNNIHAATTVGVNHRYTGTTTTAIGPGSRESDTIQPEKSRGSSESLGRFSDRSNNNKNVVDQTLAEGRLSGSKENSIMEEEVFQPRTRKTQLIRKLEERHVNWFAFSLLVGSGLFLQNGRVIYLAGPGAAIFCYPLMILTAWSVVGALGEMTALFPVPGALFELPARFLDESIGYAAGWMAWFSWVVILAAEIDAAAALFKFEFPQDYLRSQNYPETTLQWGTNSVNPAVWVTVILIISLLINLLPIRLYGEFEYCVGVTKMLFCSILILFQFAINLENNWGARYYRNPYTFFTQSFVNSEGHTLYGGAAQFAGIWSGFCTAIYSMIGFESISITAAESREFDEREHFAKREGMKISTRKVAIRILMVYTLSTLMVSFNVPADDPRLVASNAASFGGGQDSAFVIAAVRAAKTGWPSAFTAFFIFTTTSSSINSLYLSSRLLHALALSRPVWPDYPWATAFKLWLEEVTHNGVPRNAIFMSSIFGLLGYLVCGKSSGESLGNLATNSTISMLIVYVVICVTFLRFKKSLHEKVQESLQLNPGHLRGEAVAFDRDSTYTYPYRSRAQPFRVIAAGSICLLIVIFNGWASLHPFKPKSFFASYVGIVVFALIWLAYRFRQWRQPGITFWQLAPTGDMSRPTRVQRSKEEPGRDHLNLDYSHLFSVKNFHKVRRWIWVWLQ